MATEASSFKMTPGPGMEMINTLLAQFASEGSSPEEVAEARALLMQGYNQGAAKSTAIVEKQIRKNVKKELRKAREAEVKAPNYSDRVLKQMVATQHTRSQPGLSMQQRQSLAGLQDLERQFLDLTLMVDQMSPVVNAIIAKEEGERNGLLKSMDKFGDMLNVCSGPGCDKNGIESTLQKCARCREVMYCSKECQKGHWKAGHKIE